ncbi:MAG: hypothetical protein QM640_15175 [Niabella sp.]
MGKIVYFLLTWMFAFFGLSAISQNLITGNVFNSEKAPVVNALVAYSRIENDIVLGYTQTDAKGYFSLNIDLPQDSISLRITHISYEGIKLAIKNKSKDYSFTLNTSSKSLPEVIIKQPPIYRRKDTINYSVNAFTAKQDRVIGDVIKKLPGIEMDGDKILYQGQPIQKYFINGLDLLEGRYGLANNGLPIDAVQKVQIIENDQPVKILDSLVFSNRASLNIQLKKYITTGSGKVATGASPFLWDVNLTPMVFNKNFQTINSTQFNNVGDDVSRQLLSFTTDNIFEFPDAGTQQQNFLSSLTNVTGISTPEFDQKRWLRNHIGVVSSNLLKKLDNGIELKGSISYINDYKEVSGNALTTYFTQQQSVDVKEQISNGYNTNKLQASLTAIKNEKNIYLKNSFTYSKKWDSDVSSIDRNGDEISQRMGLEELALSNRLSIAKLIGSQLFAFNSDARYTYPFVQPHH